MSAANPQAHVSYVPSAEVLTLLAEVSSAINDTAKVIFDGNANKPGVILTRVAIYGKVAKACSAGMPSLQREAAKYLIGEVVAVAKREISPRFQRLADTHTDDGGGFVDAVLKFFSKCEVFVTYCRVFASLDAQLQNQIGRPRELVDQLLQCIHGLIYDPYRTRVMTDLVSRLDAHRDGDHVDQAAVQAAVTYFVKLSPLSTDSPEARKQLFDSHFFLEYYRATGRYYENRREKLLRDRGDNAYADFPQLVRDQVEFERRLFGNVNRAATGSARDLLAARLDQLVSHVACSLVSDDYMIPQGNRACSHPEFGTYAILTIARIAPTRATMLSNLYWVCEFLGRIDTKDKPKNGSVECLVAGFRQYAKERAAELCDDFDNAEETKKEQDVALVDGLIGLHAYLTTMLTNCCGKNHDVKRAFDNGMKDAIGQRMLCRKEKRGAEIKQRKMAMGELIALYVDYLARGEIEQAAEQDETKLRQLLDSVSAMVLYVAERDIFLDCYRAKLAKRLLSRPNGYNQDIDLQFIGQLKRLLGENQTLKLTSMFNDMQTNLALADEFEASPIRAQFNITTKSTATVLTAGSWPTYVSDNFSPPDSLHRFCDAFVRFYKGKYTAKKLSWCGMLGVATCELDMPLGKYSANMSVFQAGILLLIDEYTASGGVALRDVVSKLSLDANVTKSSLASMHLNKAQQLIIRVDASGTELPASVQDDTTSRYVMNAKFKSAKRSFTVAIAQLHADAGQANDEELMQRRFNSIDACVVRVMKSRRTLGSQELISLVVEQTSQFFTAELKWVKQRIEKLIEREFLKRDEEHSNVFHYLA